MSHLKTESAKSSALSQRILIFCCRTVLKTIPAFPQPLAILRELATSKSTEARRFRKNIRIYNRKWAMASLRAQFVS